MDAFAVAIVAGLTVRNLTGRHVFRVSFHFGLFQFLMSILGWIAGRAAVGYVAHFAHWVVFALLVLLGVKMLKEAVCRKPEELREKSDPTCGLMLLALSLATSIDAFGVGVSLALLNVSIWLPSVIIGLVAAVLSLIGIIFGSYLGIKWSKAAEVLGGLVLIVIGIHTLVFH